MKPLRESIQVYREALLHTHPGVAHVLGMILETTDVTWTSEDESTPFHALGKPRHLDPGYYEARRRTRMCVEMQRHRDAWRRYAYGQGDRPQDYLDGNMAGGDPPTRLDTLKAEVEAAKAERDSWQLKTQGTEALFRRTLDMAAEARAEILRRRQDE